MVNLREKVLRGLACCVAGDCESCGYDMNVDCSGFDPMPRTLLEDALAVIRGQEARLLTVADFEGNPEVDGQGFLPCWAECNEAETAQAVAAGIIEPGECIDGWTEAKVDEMPGGARHNPNVRLWTARSGDDQRKSIPWPGAPVAPENNK